MSAALEACRECNAATSLPGHWHQPACRQWRTHVHTELVAGDEAWAILNEQSGADRKTVIGAGRVRVDEVAGDVFSCTVLLANPDYMTGRSQEFKRGALYATKDSFEHNAFGALVERWWNQRGQ